MHREQLLTPQPGELTWIDLPFLSAAERPAFLQTQQELASERLATVRLLTNEPLAHYQEHLIVEVDSDHMHPRLYEGDWLRCRPIPYDAWPYLPAGVYVVHAQDGLLIRRVKANDLLQRQVLRMYPDNPQSKAALDVPEAHLRQVWQVLEIVSGSIR